METCSNLQGPSGKKVINEISSLPQRKEAFGRHRPLLHGHQKNRAALSHHESPIDHECGRCVVGTDWSLLLGRTCLESTMQTGAGWGWLEVSKRRRRARSPTGRSLGLVVRCCCQYGFHCCNETTLVPELSISGHVAPTVMATGVRGRGQFSTRRTGSRIQP